MSDCPHPHDRRAARCRSCQNRINAQEALDRTRLLDEALLKIMEDPEMSTGRLARILGVSRPQAWRRIRDAQRRQGMRTRPEST